MTELKFPTEIIDLPSKGWFYPTTHPLSSGKLELYYMTAKHEDILTSRNLIQKGVVIDKLLEALIANPSVKLDDLLLGDKAAIMVASRILGYGKDYDVNISCPECGESRTETIDLQNISDKECPYFTDEFKGRNEFTWTLPTTKKTITFKFLTHEDERSIRVELEGIKRTLKSDISKEVTTRLKRSILAVEGDSNPEKVRQFIEALPARDAQAFREYLRKVVPDIDLTCHFECDKCNHEGRVEIPIDVNFFWPSARV